VTLYALDDLEGKDDELYHGYFGFLRFDNKLVDDDPYFEHVRLTIYSGSKLVIEAPALPRAHQTNEDRDEFEKDEFITENMIKAMDIKRNKYLKDVNKDKGKNQDRRWKRLFLEFPDDHLLSLKELAGDHEENEVPFEIVEDNDNAFWIVFKVVSTHVEGNKAGKSVDGVTQKLSKMALKAKKKKGGAMNDEEF